MKKFFIAACVCACFVTAPVWAEVNDKVTEKNETKQLPPEMKWELMSTAEEPTDTQLELYPGQGHFERLAAYYHELFKKTYLVKEKVVPGDPTQRIVIRKPDIYNAVRSVEKALGKAVKNKQITNEECNKNICHILEVSIAAADTDTQSLEAALGQNKKDPETLLAIFNKVSLTNIYK